MKTVLLCSIVFCAIVLPGFAELTDADLNKIRLIVQEEIKEELKPIKADLDILKTDGASVKTEVTNLKEAANKDFETIQKNFDRQNNIIIACIGIPMAILAIGATVWGILAHKRSIKDNTQSIEEFTLERMKEFVGALAPGEKLELMELMYKQEQKIESLTQEVETLKQQRTVSS